MGLRSTLVKAMGGTLIVPDGVPVQTSADMVSAGMTPDRQFSPGTPMEPSEGFFNTPRTRDFPTGINISSRPRYNEQISFGALKGLVNAYDIAQICIWHRIDSVRSLDWRLTPHKEFAGDPGKLIQYGKAVLSRPDREFPFKTWLAKFLFDILAYDAGTLYKMRNGVGQPVGLRVLDGTTIAPLLDDWGNRPSGEAPAFVQFAQGIPWEWLRAEDVIYEPFRPRSDSMYGKAPLETILLNANTDLRFQTFFLNHFTEGNIPEGFAGAPEGWNPDQILEYQQKWDALLYGDDTQKHQLKWVPFGTRFDWAKSADFNDMFSLFLMRKTAAAYHVVPADLGFTEDVNRASGDTQADVQFRVGDLPLIQHVQDILSSFLWFDMGLPLEFKFNTGEEVEDSLITAQKNKIYVEMGAISVSEVREGVYGLDEPGGKPVPRFVMTNRAGPVPLIALEAVAGPIDPDSGAPAIGAPFPHKPFAPIEGVAPQKPEDVPPLAVQQYPADNAASVQAEATADNAAVVKDAAGISVLGETVAVADPLLAEEETEHRYLTIADAKAAAVEKAAFRRFAKARAVQGKWRDFAFNVVPPDEARELNRRQRAQIRKDAGTVSVAGLVVRATDTGRVLMLQRALDPNDPAGGMWEFPGGHLEDGEDPAQAALREWCEETGCPPPAQGTITGQWVSSNGIYQGFVLTIPSEADVDINPAVPHLANPDDPDGDIVETVAWWDPHLLAGNPAVRTELQQDLTIILPALGIGEVMKADAWSSHPMRKVEDALLAHHAPKVQEALRSMVSKEDLRAAVARYLGQ